MSKKKKSKEVPLMFRTPMVLAILNDTKTETRRLSKLQQLDGNKCQWEVGQIIWVKETYADGYNGSLDPNIGKDPKDWTLWYWCFKDGGQKYSNGTIFPALKKYNKGSSDHIKWKPSMFMPRKVARLFLEITEIGFERLQEITPAACIAEGIESKMGNRADMFRNYLKPDDWTADPVKSYKSLWESINGPESWQLNPFVWVIKFRKLDNYAA